MEYVLKRYHIGYVAEAVAFVVVFVSVSMLHSSGLTASDALQALLFFIPCVAVHEFSHYAVAKRYSPSARIRVLPKLGAIVLDYVSLDYGNCVKVTLAPLLTVQLPITALYLLTHKLSILLLAILHLAASLVDITEVMHATLLHYGGRLHLVYDERNRIVGILVEEPAKNRATFYML